MDDHRWETEALRTSLSRRGGRPTVSQDRRPVSSEPAVWVTLREASDATGIPVGTLGSWARRGTVDSYLEGNGGRKLRIVDLNAVRGRAHELGRPVAPVPIRVVEVAPSAAESGSAASPPLRGGDEEMMIVPLDAWNKMLNQLGNLHEAGQQLAEARERAAKAETEATFLRERLSELRAIASPSGGGAEGTEAEGVKPMSRPRSDPPPGPDGPYSPLRGEEGPEPATSTTVRLWRYLSDAWKSRRR